MNPPVHPASRRSPVRFASTALDRARRDGWEVVRRYQDEGAGPFIVDLSHRRRWDFQHRRPDDHRPLGCPVPPAPGDVLVHDGLVITRMNRTQLALWHLGPGAAPAAPAEPSYTDMTDGHCMLAFLGAAVPAVLEHLTDLDLFDPARPSPRLTQGPVLHVPSQVVSFDTDCVLMTFSRGYGQTFVDAALHAARARGLRPAGEDAFHAWFARSGAARG